MRILLHPSVADQIARAKGLQPSAMLRLPIPPVKGGIAHELNYVAINFTGTLDSRVSEMRSRASQRFHRHYDETLAAMVRMKAAFST